jgi:NitT/TauT family transport system permease protein
MSDAREVVPERPETIYAVQTSGLGVIQKPLSFWEKLADFGGLRKTLILIFLALVWELYARWLHNPLVFPTFGATLLAFRDGIVNGELPAATWHSMKVLFQGYLIGLVLAGLFTAFASATRIGSDLLETLTAMFNPLPSIALLPLAMIWFGFGNAGIIFVLIHAVLWSVALNTHAGFRGVSPTWRMVGQNYGLSRVGYVTRILIPGAFPSILTGLKIGWAFAWRTLIAAELVFGANAGGGGLGWYIFETKNALEIPSVFAGLLTVILLGIVVENVVFLTIERKTVRRWGMQT